MGLAKINTSDEFAIWDYLNLWLGTEMLAEAKIEEHTEIIDGVPRNTGMEFETPLTGANLTGIDGNLNRTYPFKGDLNKIFVDGIYLHNTDYSYDKVTITFLNEIWDSQKISIWEQV